VTPAAVAIAALWAAFAATHMALSSRGARPRLVAALGERGFLGAYSLLALVLFSALCAYAIPHRHQGALLWSVPLGTGTRWAIYAGQGVAWTLVVAALASPGPATVGLPAERRPAAPRGVHRITRHPLFMGLGLFGALHLVVNGFASDVAFWLGFPAFTVLGCLHQDARKRATQPGYAAWCDATPLLPFTGGGLGRAVAEIPPIVPLLGVALAAGLRWLHGPLFH
jgi:uncharacterized membrane protein